MTMETAAFMIVSFSSFINSVNIIRLIYRVQELERKIRL